MTVALHAPSALALAGRLAAASVSPTATATLDRESLALALLAEVHAVPESAHHDAPAWLARACAHLDESLGADISIRDIAHTAGVHPVHLSRVFRRCLGVTPAEYRRQRRLAHASALLRETRRPLADIALACGFSDQPHFSTAFRRAFGVTPSEHRGR